MTFTHNNVNDTVIERDGNEIDFTFYGDTFTYDDPDQLTFRMGQDELFEKLGEYFDSGNKSNSDIFDDLTLPAQDALWNALVWLNQNNVSL